MRWTKERIKERLWDDNGDDEGEAARGRQTRDDYEAIQPFMMPSDAMRRCNIQRKWETKNPLGFLTHGIVGFFSIVWVTIMIIVMASQFNAFMENLDLDI